MDLNQSQILSYLMFTQLESEGCQLNFHIDSSDSVNFLAEMEQLPKFVFFHSELNCHSCVEENIPFLTEFGNVIGPENMIFLATYKNKRDLTLFKRVNKIQSYIYNVSSVGLSLEKLNLPFCFVINKEHKAECVFVPIKENSLHFQRYIEVIKRKYFSEKDASTQQPLTAISIQQQEIKVEITPGELGVFHKTIRVYCNTEKGAVSLAVKGMVEQ